MNVFASGHRHQPWIWQVTILCFFLGVLLAASLQTRYSVTRFMVGTERVGIPPALTRETLQSIQQRDKEIDALRKRNADLGESLTKGTKRRKKLNDELDRLRIMAGFTPVHGPGIVLTLQDSKRREGSFKAFDISNGIIHDLDVRQVLDELGQSGAEAIAVNNQRIVSRTYVRCVGPSVLVNNVPLTTPFTITAIGDPDTLWSGLNMPFGVLDSIRRYDPNMIKIEKKKQLEIPAYTGSTEVRYAKPDKASNAKTSEEDE